MSHDYVHGYSERESLRLQDQANTLSELLHRDTCYPPGSRVLEAGSGIGAQSFFLARNSPGAHITCMDVSPASLRTARDRLKKEGIGNVDFCAGDIFHFPFPKGSFDHVFICFVLEHLKDPHGALVRLHSMLKTGGSITVIEGDHGSAFFHPESTAARRAIQCLIDIQAGTGGNALIGRQLYPLLKKTGFRSVHVSPRMVYADSSRLDLVDGFIRNTFTAMVEGVREEALAGGLVNREQWEQGIADLNATAGPDGVFCYTFFKAVAIR
jgi:ubiquinone/menaquinone biosynthesis C-methylase UbiE